MDKNFDSRTKKLLENDYLKIKNSNICICGLGGVGSFVFETLVRIGISNITIIDFDKIDITNINRQLLALNSNVGKFKVDAAILRAKDINKDINIKAYKTRLNKNNIDEIIDNRFDYVVDAIDDVFSKIELIKRCKENNINIISSMGMGNKINASEVMIADIKETSSCKLAKVLRKELKVLGINKLKVVFSKEVAVKSTTKVLGSVSYIPALAGILISGEVIKDIIKSK